DFEAQGLKALDARQYQEAAALFSKAVSADPKDYSAHFNLGLAYSLLGKDADAITEYKSVLKLHPGLYEAELNLGICQLRTKDAAAAAANLKLAAQQKPNQFQPQFYLGEASLAAGQFTEAEAAYRAAMTLNANSAPAELGLGRALAREGRRSEAEPYYRKAVALNPSFKNALLELASLYEENRQPGEAIALYREFPQNPGAQERLGALLLESGHASDAVPPLEMAVTASPTPANRLLLAQAYVHEKQLPLAELQAAEAAKAAPADVQLQLFYGRILRDERKFPAAAAQFLAITQRKPDSADAWNELAGVYLTSGDYTGALAAFDHVKALGKETTAHFFFRGMAYDHLHQTKQALENYQKFLAGSHGEHPDQEFQARQRAKILEKELGKR
ncbi:MAG TPA: tetratricopeptide repeat protein, partial [Bryobacteraceae bacterium]|nr:tetratricopeptide repeat protein [Bryobacteraceae bacterium]